MAKNKGRFIIDDSVPKDVRDKLGEKAQKNIEQMKMEISERSQIIEKRQDFFDGNHHKWTNVVGQAVKQQEGHILQVINYIARFVYKIYQSLTNHPPRVKIVPEDEANEVETARAEAVEEAVLKVLRDNSFWEVIYKKLTINQLRDADFTFEIKVLEDAEKKRRIEITPNENLLKVFVGWDDAQGSSFSFAGFSELWSVDKIKREFDYEAEAVSSKEIESENKGDHIKDQYGLMSTGSAVSTPSGKNQTPKAKITDYWSYEVLKTKDDKTERVRVVNQIFINKEQVQFYVTDYKEIPRLIGHSLLVAGKPWSKGFIDDLIDPQIELNDRSGEEGDLIRIGSHMKFLAINMTDFDPSSVAPGSGQVIFIEGENADFRPLQMTISPFPSQDYLERTMEHLFTLGIPKISLASGTAPYTGKVGAIQYQPYADLVDDFRIQWESVLRSSSKMIQQFFIDFFPETHSFMKESLYDEDSGEYQDGDFVIRDIEFDWENILPLSRSDKVVDASTLRDRNAISLSTYLEQAGFRDPGKEIKKLKKESKDDELMAILPKFSQFSKGAVELQLEAQKQMAASEEANAETMGAVTDATKVASQPAKAPVLNSSQNDGRRGVMTGAGTPTGQTRTQRGAVTQSTQNMNAQAGV